MPTQPPIVTPQEATFLDELRGFITQPRVMLLGPLILVAMFVLGLYLYRRRGGWHQSQNSEPLTEQAEPEGTSSIPSLAASARIALPNGTDIQLVGNNRTIGRGDLARVLELDELGLISRRHFTIRLENERFYIEDLGSANGTKLNGADIKDKGLVSLDDDDVIEPAGIVPLKFYIL
jgi:hypothetical protein